MGEAKHRGTFEDRRLLALKREHSRAELLKPSTTIITDGRFSKSVLVKSPPSLIATCLAASVAFGIDLHLRK